MKNFRSKEWLIENISREDLKVFDARAELNDPKAGYNQYINGHIKGSQYIDLEEVMTGKISQHGGRHPLPLMNNFIDQMMAYGVDDLSTIIIYDKGDYAMAGRLWWLLKYAGKEKVYILEGGYEQWLGSNLEITQDIIKPKIATRLNLNINNSLIADIDDVKNAINTKNIAIIDSRAYERYSGEVEPLDRIPGHIPNALNYPWTNLVGENKKSLEELNLYFKKLKDFDELLVHCGSGITGTVNMLFLEEIGLKSKLYPGGYSDWVSYPNNEVVVCDK